VRRGRLGRSRTERLAQTHGRQPVLAGRVIQDGPRGRPVGGLRIEAVIPGPRSETFLTRGVTSRDGRFSLPFQLPAQFMGKRVHIKVVAQRLPAVKDEPPHQRWHVIGRAQSNPIRERGPVAFGDVRVRYWGYRAQHPPRVLMDPEHPNEVIPVADEQAMAQRWAGEIPLPLPEAQWGHLPSTAWQRLDDHTFALPVQGHGTLRFHQDTQGQLTCQGLFQEGTPVAAPESPLCQTAQRHAIQREALCWMTDVLLGLEAVAIPTFRWLLHSPVLALLAPHVRDVALLNAMADHYAWSRGAWPQHSLDATPEEGMRALQEGALERHPSAWDGRQLPWTLPAAPSWTEALHDALTLHVRRQLSLNEQALRTHWREINDWASALHGQVPRRPSHHLGVSPLRALQGAYSEAAHDALTHLLVAVLHRALAAHSLYRRGLLPWLASLGDPAEGARWARLQPGHGNALKDNPLGQLDPWLTDAVKAIDDPFDEDLRWLTARITWA